PIGRSGGQDPHQHGRSHSRPGRGARKAEAAPAEAIMNKIVRIGLVGGGVIGTGWAARFLLNGYDVAVFDPDPEIGRKLSEVLANARRANAKLMSGLALPEGSLRIAASV